MVGRGLTLIKIAGRLQGSNRQTPAKQLFSPEESLLAQLVLQAILQFRADFADFHACANQELATQQFVRAIFIREFSYNAAILAILIPAETPVRNGFRTDVLEAAKNRIFLRDLKSFSQNFDFDQSFVWPKYLCAAV
jgi:hypothetical protein